MFVLCHLKRSFKQIQIGQNGKMSLLGQTEERGVFLELKLLSKTSTLTVYQELMLLREVTHPLCPEVL